MLLMCFHYFTIIKGGSRTGAPEARPLFKNIVGFDFSNFEGITRKYFSCIIKLQYLQYLFYTLPLLQKHKLCVKWHLNKSQTTRILPRRYNAPGFEITGSATDCLHFDKSVALYFDIFESTLPKDCLLVGLVHLA